MTFAQYISSIFHPNASTPIPGGIDSPASNSISSKYGTNNPGAGGYDYAFPAIDTQQALPGQKVMPTPLEYPNASPITTPNTPRVTPDQNSELQGPAYFQNLVDNDPDPHVKVSAQSWLDRNAPNRTPAGNVQTTAPIGANAPDTSTSSETYAGNVSTGATGPTGGIPDTTDVSGDSSGSTAIPDTTASNVPYSIAQYKEDINQPNLNTADLYRIAYKLNDTRNNIATGTIDPYGVGATPGVAFTPEQLMGIQEGLGKSYDPAVDDVNARIKQSESSDTATSTQDKLEQAARQGLLKAYQSRSGDIGTQNAKVTAAIAAQTAIDSYKQKDGTYNIPPSALGDLVIKTATLLNGNGSVSNDQLSAITQATAKGQIGAALGYLGINANGATQAVAQNLAKIIQTQGTVAEQSRDQELAGLEATSIPTDLDPDRTAAIEQAFESNFPSYSYYLQTGKVSPGSGGQKFGGGGGSYVGNPDGSYPDIPPPSFKKVGSDTKTAMNIPKETNNPLDIEATSYSVKLPGVAGVHKTSDGRQFLAFSSPEAGFNAAKQLLTSPIYQGLTVDQALRKWSGGGYGGEIVPQIANAPVGSLNQNQLNKVVQQMAHQEGYYA